MYRIDDYYSLSKDQKIFNELEKLFDTWKKGLCSTMDPKLVKNQWNSDGIFPGYSKADFKILFIGTENRIDYVDEKSFKKIDNHSLLQKINEWRSGDLPNRSHYWKRIAMIIDGVKNGGQRSNLDSREIISNMCKDNNYGFAHMEISKLANQGSDGGTADNAMVRNFLKNTDLEYISEEIRIINPDLIVTQNLWRRPLGIQSFLEQIFNISYEPEKGKIFDVTVAGKQYKLVNIYHLSAAITEEDFYTPILKAYNEYRK